MELGQEIDQFIGRLEALPVGDVGYAMWEKDETGHTRLCRLLHAVAHYGQGGTFVHIASQDLPSGGQMCAFGVECGAPHESYLRHLGEFREEFDRVTRILEANGGLVSMAWQNPKFSSQGLCKCGKADEQKCIHHDPLCPYRVEHEVLPTFAEYRAALMRV